MIEADKLYPDGDHPFYELLEGDAEKVYDQSGLDAANEFVGIARGQLTPIPVHVDTWLASCDIAEGFKQEP